jgi:hypothetical protein
MIASKLKMNAPYCHTSVLSEVQGKSADVTSFLEIINARWGTVAHFVFMFFGLATNVIVSSRSSPTLGTMSSTDPQPCLSSEDPRQSPT